MLFLFMINLFYSSAHENLTLATLYPQLIKRNGYAGKTSKKRTKIPRFRLEGPCMTVQNLLFCAHAQCMSYVTNSFLLVRSSVRRKQLLCFVQGQGQKTEQKPTTKDFVGFHNHSPLLTMPSLGKDPFRAEPHSIVHHRRNNDCCPRCAPLPSMWDSVGR